MGGFIEEVAFEPGLRRRIGLHLTERRERRHRGEERQEQGPRWGQSVTRSRNSEEFVAGVKGCVWCWLERRQEERLVPGGSRFAAVPQG